MSTKKFDEVKEEIIKMGGFHVQFYFDMHANDTESLKNIMVGFIGKLTKEDGVALAVGEINKPIKDEKEPDLYSSTAKVTILIKNFATLTRLSMSYAPIAIEIEDPLDVKIGAGELQRAMIGISATAQELTQHIFRSSLNEEQIRKFEKQMIKKAEFGKQIREKTNEKKVKE